MNEEKENSDVDSEKNSILSDKSISGPGKEKHDDENITENCLTYIPCKPSKHRITPDSSDIENNHNECSQNGGGSVHNLRHLAKENYFMTALPSTITTDDGSRIRLAFSFLKRTHQIHAINETLDTLIENKTWVGDRPLPVKVKALPSMIILKLKRDETGNLAKFKSLFVAMSNMQDKNCPRMKLYAHVIFIELVRALLPVAQVERWSVRYLYFKEHF